YNEEINKINASFTEKQKKAAITKLKLAEKAEKAEKSFMGRIGKTIAPVFAPIGIDWRGSVALLTGFVAKEIVVSTFGILYATEETNEPDALKNALLSSEMTSLSALSLMVFVLLYLPCVATIATIRRETGSLKWTLFSIVYSTSLAWAAAFCIYQGGKILGLT
ncbi:MAG: ferrous iron transporter B, partial [Candidatus Atribacteria bacterium]|nr:ferrous iron transporter B [Candidatus Atribacteria bacterium]